MKRKSFAEFCEIAKTKDANVRIYTNNCTIYLWKEQTGFSVKTPAWLKKEIERHRIEAREETLKAVRQALEIR